MTKKPGSDRADIYTRITDRIVEDLEKGVRPWMKPWSSANTSGRISRPVRHNGLPYSGMNVLLLWSEQIANGFASSMWMTFKHNRSTANSRPTRDMNRLSSTDSIS